MYYQVSEAVGRVERVYAFVCHLLYLYLILYHS